VSEFGEALQHLRLVVDLLRGSSAAEPDADAIAELLHPELDVLAIPGLAPGQGYRSREEFLEGYFGESRRIGQHIEVDVSRVRVSPTAAILVDGRLRISVGDNTELVDAWFVYRFRDGRISAFGNYLEPTAAERAAGF
jgi:ketosteroid isomerase-like protein